VGDSRAWHFRDGVLTRLTEDHTLSQPGLNHVLYRAVGIEQDVKLDVRVQPLKAHDRLLLTSDGVHGVVDEDALCRLLARRASPDADAQAIVDAATQAETRDNATAVVLDVVRIAAIDRDAIGAEAEGLPILETPKLGDKVDGYSLERVLSDGKYTRLFLGRDGADPTPLVLKFPKPTLVSEQGARAAFLRESFIGRWIDSPFVGKTLPVEAGRQSRLYIVQPFYDGQTLHARLANEGGFDIQTGVATAIRLARGVEALHRQRIAHRDIKPDNVVLERSGGLKLIDLGVARLPRLEGLRVDEFSETEAPGTPGFMAPEMFAGEAGNAATDQFALGVTLYRLFAGPHYPFGEVEAGARPRFDRPTRPTFHRPDMPAWLEAAILRTLSVDPDDRFADVQELIHVLESGSAVAAPMTDSLSLMERYPVRFWQAISALLAVLLFVSVVTR
jgi:serine/threonine protein kinase